MKTWWNEFCFEDVFARFKADTSVSEESKDFIASRVFNHRIFSREWDARCGNGLCCADISHAKTKRANWRT